MIKEDVWQQLIQYIDSNDLFFPQKIREKLSPEAEDILDQFIELMVEEKMLKHFRKKNFAYRIAYWFYCRKMKFRKGEKGLAEIYLKGSNWDQYKAKKLIELEKGAVDESEIIH